MSRDHAESESSPAPHLGPKVDERVERDQFAPAELAVVLSHYELGVIQRIREYRRGSRRSPKVRIWSDRGQFLLKRRAPNRGHPDRVRFAQTLQHRLDRAGFPVAPLVPARGDGSTMLEHDEQIYEMFRYVDGRRDDGSPDAAKEAGRTLGRLHRLVEPPPASAAVPEGTYHNAWGAPDAFRRVPAAVTLAEPARSVTELAARCGTLKRLYEDAAERAGAAGFADWPANVVHGDWHPGNLLYRGGRVVAVLDFDSARIAPRAIDLANGALQFSMLATGDDPREWPDEMDVNRALALLTGYDETAETPVTAAERDALPWLMLEALILEGVLPIAHTGRFASLSGADFLEMLERKAKWLRPRGRKLTAFLAGVNR